MCDLQKEVVSNGFAVPVSVEYSSYFSLQLQVYLTLQEKWGKDMSAYETVSMENCNYTAAPSVKSKQKLVFGGLGTGLNMTDAH